MAKTSYLIQNTVNQILDITSECYAQNTPLPTDLTLAKTIDVSRTSIRRAVDILCDNDVLYRDGTVKHIFRKPKKEDYFKLNIEEESKEKQFEAYFLNLIHSGQLQPGDKFSELDLAKKSGCITITVREFLIRFSHMGLIEKKPRSQWQMVKFTADFARELIEFRKILEMAALRSLLERPEGDSVWEQLGELLREHKALLRDIDNRFNDFPALDSRLHNIIQNCSGNRFIGQFFEIVKFICHYHYQWDKSDELERNQIAAQEHINLIENLLARDLTGSIISLERHLQTAHQTLLSSANGLSITS